MDMATEIVVPPTATNMVDTVTATITSVVDTLIKLALFVEVNISHVFLHLPTLLATTEVFVS
jgi:hypothetical protein